MTFSRVFLIHVVTVVFLEFHVHTIDNLQYHHLQIRMESTVSAMYHQQAFSPTTGLILCSCRERNILHRPITLQNPPIASQAYAAHEQTQLLSPAAALAHPNPPPPRPLLGLRSPSRPTSNKPRP